MGKPAGSTTLSHRTLKIMSLVVVTEEIVPGASFNLKRLIFSNVFTATSLDLFIRIYFIRISRLKFAKF